MASQRATYGAMNWRAAKLSYYLELTVYISQSCSQLWIFLKHSWGTDNSPVLSHLKWSNNSTLWKRPSFPTHWPAKFKCMHSYCLIFGEMSWNDLLSQKHILYSFFMNHRGNSLVQIILHLIWSIAWLTNTSSTKHCSEINAFLETVFVDLQHTTAPWRLGECSQSRLDFVWLNQ